MIKKNIYIYINIILKIKIYYIIKSYNIRILGYIYIYLFKFFLENDKNIYFFKKKNI